MQFLLTSQTFAVQPIDVSIPAILDHLILFAEEQFSCSGEFACCERVEIESTRDGLAYVIFAIPIRRSATTLIDTRRCFSYC